MRFHQFLLPLALLFTPSLTSPSDDIYIQQLTNGFAVAFDNKNSKELDNEFIPNGTYDAGGGPVKGIPNIAKTLAGLVVGNVTQTSVTTQSITLAPPFDAQGTAAKASAITYAIVSFIGQGADAGKVYIVYGFWTDVLVKTGAFEFYGGWRFSSRAFKALVSACHTHGVLRITIDVFALCTLHMLAWIIGSTNCSSHQGTAGDKSVAPAIVQRD